MGGGEGEADFDDLAVAIGAAEIDGGAHGGGAHVPGHFYGAEEDLVGFVGIGEEFVVIDFYEEGNFVGVFARDGAEDAEGGGDGVAAALDGQLDDIFTVEVDGVFGEAGAGGVLDALIDGENGEIAGAAEAAVMEHAAEIGDDAGIAVGVQPDAVDEIGTGKMEKVLGDFGIAETEQGIGFGAEHSLDGVGWCGGGGHFVSPLSIVIPILVHLANYFAISFESMDAAALSSSQSNFPLVGLIN